LGAHVLNIGLSELLVVAIAGLVFIGPERLPNVMRFFGRMVAKVRFATKDLTMAFQQEIDKVEGERRTVEIARRREALRLRREQESDSTGAAARDPHIPLVAKPANGQAAVTLAKVIDPEHGAEE
jgi:sec-independent protein translocase protein TatB